MSALDSGVDLECEDMNLNDVLGRVISTFAGVAAAKTQTLSFALDAELPLVCADEHYLHQALQCLVENAIIYTPAGARLPYAQPPLTTPRSSKWQTPGLASPRSTSNTLSLLIYSFSSRIKIGLKIS